MARPNQLRQEPLREEEAAALHAELESKLRARGVAPFSTLESFWQDAGIRPEDLSDDDLRAFSALPEILQQLREEDRARVT